MWRLRNQLSFVRHFSFLKEAENDTCNRFLWPRMLSIYTEDHRAFYRLNGENYSLEK